MSYAMPGRAVEAFFEALGARLLIAVAAGDVRGFSIERISPNETDVKVWRYRRESGAEITAAGSFRDDHVERMSDSYKLGVRSAGRDCASQLLEDVMRGTE